MRLRERRAQLLPRQPEVVTTTRWDGGGQVGWRSITPTTAEKTLTSPAADMTHCHTADQGDFARGRFSSS